MTTTTETPMRERIARVLDKTAFDPPDGHWHHFETRRNEAFEVADAVLDVMREPSSVQRRAAQKAHDKWGASSSMLLSDLFNDIWRAMLDAAKEGK